MEKRLEQIQSDTTIVSVSFEKDKLVLRLLLYTERPLEVVFEKYYSLILSYGWNVDEVIESVHVLQESESIKDLTIRLNHDEVVFEKLYEFQFRDSFGEVVLTVVSEDLLINGAAIALR